MTDFRKLLTLVLMQVKEKIDLGFLKSRKLLTFIIIRKILLISIFTIGIYLGLYYGQVFNLFKLVTNYTMIFFITIILSVSVISCTITLMKTFYFSDDNFMLFSFAVKPNIIFLSKLVMAFIIELNRNITYLVPFFLAYGLVRQYPPVYYLNFTWLFIILSLSIVVVSAFLSLPAMIFTKLLKKIKFLHIIFLVGISILTWLVIEKIVFYIPEDFTLLGRWSYYSSTVNRFLISFSKYAFPFNHITQLLVGNNGYLGYKFLTSSNLKILGLFIAIIFLGIVLTYIVTRYVFFKMVTNSYIKKKNSLKFKRRNHKLPPVVSGIKKEFLLLFRTPSLFFQNIIYLVILPMAIYLLNRVFIAINLRQTGYDLCMSFNLLMIVIISLTSTSSLATSFGNEKSALFQTKTRPIKLLEYIIGKVFFQMILTTISVYIACRIVYNYQPISYHNFIYFFLIVVMINFAYLFWIIQFDLSSPFNNDMLFNKTELKSYLLIFIISFVAFLVSNFLLTENRNLTWMKVFYAALLLCGLRFFILHRYIKIYYRELGGRC